MGEVLKVCRLGTDWAVKDRSGAFYCATPKLDEAVAYAKAWAKRTGCSYVVKDEQGAKRG